MFGSSAWTQMGRVLRMPSPATLQACDSEQAVSGTSALSQASEHHGRNPNETTTRPNRYHVPHCLLPRRLMYEMMVLRRAT
jgi:hypothetical protein